MKVLITVLITLLLVLQYRLWFGEGSVEQIAMLKKELQQQQALNLELENRNKRLAAEIRDLKTGLESIEERARSDLGMIRQGETYYLFVDKRTLVNQGNILPEDEASESGESGMANEVLKPDLQEGQ